MSSLLNIQLEIHQPGLNLHRDRMNRHRIFMDIVHEHIRKLAAFAWKEHDKQGRGAVYVNQRQWREAVRAKHWENAGEAILPFAYLRSDMPAVEVDVDRLGRGFQEMLRTYDPETTFVLLVEHPPGEVLSAYRVDSNPTPAEAYAQYAEEHAS